MRLKSLQVENFRCFRQQEFDLSADVIAIYGRNGTGKTALFDALEFCLTGDIARFGGDQTEIPARYLVNAFTGAPTKVRLEMNSEESHWLEVEHKDNVWDMRCSDGSRTRKDFFFAKMVNDDYLPARKEFDPLVELFRATILLSQASMCDFIEAPAGERSGLISNLVGAAYLQRCLEKARGVIAEGKRRLRRVTADIGEMQPRVNQVEEDIRQHEARVAALEDSGRDVSTIVGDLFDIYRELVTNDISRLRSEPHDQDQVAAMLAAVCNEQLEQVRVSLAALSETSARMPQHAARLVERDATFLRLQELRENSLQVTNSERALSARIAQEQTAANDLRLAAESLEANYNRLTRQAELFASCDQLETTSRTLQNKLAIGERERDAAAETVTNLESTVADTSAKVAAATSGVMTASKLANGFEELKSGFQEYSNRQQLVNARREEARQSEERVSQMATARQELRTEESNLSDRLEQLSRESIAATADNAEIVRAILKLQGQSKDGVCPLCNHHHDSEEELQNEITAKLSQISEQAARFQRESRELEEKRAGIRQRIATLDNETAELKRVSDERNRSIESLLQANHAIEALALRLGTPLDLEVIERQLNHQKAATVMAENNLREAQTQTGLTDRNLSEARSRLNSANQQVSVDSAALAILQRQKAEIDREIAVSEEPSAGIDARIEATRNRLVAKRGEYEAKAAANAVLQRELTAEREHAAEMGRNISNVERPLLDITQAIESMTARLRSLKLPEDSTREHLNELRETLLSREARLLRALDLTRQYEVQRKRALIASEGGALRANLSELIAARDRLNVNRNEIEAATAEAEKWESTLVLLVKESVSQRLNQHRIESFRLFQSMIPTPYLFDDISVSQTEGGVRLGLHYRGVSGDVGEPRYFLSSAQANVLALSYFLSFARRQRWCKLRTILMDDPVQHLDDLDAVALLDVIRALVVSDAKPRQQMIISTCDYNLYALMIRKFGGLPAEKLRFAALSFHDIGANGPEVRYDYGGTANSLAA